MSLPPADRASDRDPMPRHPGRSRRRLDLSLVAELEQDLADAKRDRERLLRATLMGDPAEAERNWRLAWEINEKWIRRYERRLEEARAKEEA
jgi:hypothetical protein